MPRALSARPTTDRAREALFGILSARFDFAGLSVLDGFAGSGAVSLEFASRGARVTAVETESAACRFIRDTAKKWNAEQVRVVRADALNWLQTCEATWDVLFFDPPYAWPRKKELPAVSRERGLIAPGGLLVLEHPEYEVFDDAEGWQETRQYGYAAFSLFDPAV